MTLTKTRLVDLDNIIDLGGGITLQSQVTSQTGLTKTGTTNLTFALASSISVSGNNVDLTWGNFNTPNTPPTLRYNSTSNQLVFGNNPDSTGYSAVILADDTGYTNSVSHLGTTSATAHGGFIESVQASDISDVLKGIAGKQQLIVKDTNTISHTTTVSAPTTTLESTVITSPTVQVYSTDWTSAGTLVAGFKYVCYTGVVSFGSVAAAGTSTQAIDLTNVGAGLTIDTTTPISIAHISGTGVAIPARVVYDIVDSENLTLYATNHDTSPTNISVQLTIWLKQAV